ncbi:gustatory receptor for sugar taste 64f-like [Aphidius gifuensis]|uniref:gustatory receptor for sugar taste 64f-like n=1 Tax=Aphidius gifuensis TaxID=684658 RepID=UPI001CDD61E5|nr:gustatory receptor for sugar taste 64f-like [Aphidius gifuensis]
MKPIITVSQFFGNFPINGIQNSKPDGYVFKIPSFITGYSLMIITLMGIFFAADINETISSTKENFFKTLFHALFFGYNFLVLLIIFCKSPRWIKLQMNWQRVEGKLDNFSSSYQTKFRLRFKLRMISLILCFCALIEHMYSYEHPLSHVPSAEKYFSLIGENILKTTFGSLDGISHNSAVIVGILHSMLRTFATFTWNFCDLLIILVSIGLAERYKHLNEVVRFKISNNSTERINWRKIKKTYAIMNELVKEADNIVSPLILLSCCMNVYLICVQTSEGIRSVMTESKIPIYFFLSLFFMIIRTIALVLSVAKINVESSHASTIFTRCLSVFIIEVILMQQQLSIDKVSFTAMKFFPITRKFIFTITGTIVTYGILYMQLRTI